jgi:hypothetical protein
MSEEASQAVYERYHVPGTGRVLFQAATANLKPHAATKVDFNSESRAPLLVVGGGKDNTVPSSMAKEAAARQSKAKSASRVQRVPRPLALHAGPGRLGGGRRLRPRLGHQARRDPLSDLSTRLARR